jgi:hypothetical protein
MNTPHMTSDTPQVGHQPQETAIQTTEAPALLQALLDGQAHIEQATPLMSEQGVPSQSDPEDFAWLAGIHDIAVQETLAKHRSIQEAETFYQTQYNSYKPYEPILQQILTQKILHYAEEALQARPIPDTVDILKEAIKELEAKHIPNHLQVQYFAAEGTPKHTPPQKGSSQVGPLSPRDGQHTHGNSWFGVPAGVQVANLSDAEFEKLTQRIHRHYYK